MRAPRRIDLFVKPSPSGHYCFELRLLDKVGSVCDYRPSRKSENMESFYDKCMGGTRVHIRHLHHRRVVEFIKESNCYYFLGLCDKLYISGIKKFLGFCGRHGVDVVLSGENGHGVVTLTVRNGRVPRRFSSALDNLSHVRDLVEQMPSATLPT